MIIKWLFRRYKRWNPVHPTLGTFWGMGVGVGCGVGWGPGYGPEVIGYVGAGCGVGFGVGFTLLGVGIGLPKNGLIRIPINASATSGRSSESTGSDALTTMKTAAGSNLSSVAPYLSLLRKEITGGRLSSFMTNVHAAQAVELTKLHKTWSNHITSTLSCLEAFKDRCWSHGKDV